MYAAGIGWTVKLQAALILVVGGQFAMRRIIVLVRIY